MMTTQPNLLDEIEEFLRLSGMRPSTLGHKTANDGKLVSRLRNGSTVTLATAEAILAFIQERRASMALSSPSFGDRQRRVTIGDTDMSISESGVVLRTGGLRKRGRRAVA